MMLHWVQHVESVHLSKEAMSSKVLQVHQESAIIFPAFDDFGGKCHLFNNLRIGTASMLHSLMNKILSMQLPSKGLQVYDFSNLWFSWIHGSKRWSCGHQNRRSKRKGKWCLSRIIC